MNSRAIYRAKPLVLAQKNATKIGLLLIGVVGTIAALIIGLQIYYQLTPTALSPDAVRLNERAAMLPTLTENGHRLYGIVARNNVDPVRALLFTSGN